MTSLYNMVQESKKLSARTQKALEVIKAGGAFVERLERNSYTNRETFKHRLQDVNGRIVGGFGLNAFYDLKDRGYLSLDYYTSVSSYYRLNKNRPED